MGGENIGQAGHRFNERVNITRSLATHAFEDFVAAQFL